MALNRVLHGIEGAQKGVGKAAAQARKEHKLLCLKLYTELLDELDADDYEVVEEWVVDQNDLDSPAPDIVIFERGYSVASIIIEITTAKQFNYSIEKIEALRQLYPAVVEAYVYDYERYKWYATRDDKDDDYGKSYSPMLDIDFSDIVE